MCAVAQWTASCCISNASWYLSATSTVSAPVVELAQFVGTWDPETEVFTLGLEAPSVDPVALRAVAQLGGGLIFAHQPSLELAAPLGHERAGNTGG